MLPVTFLSGCGVDSSLPAPQDGDCFDSTEQQLRERFSELSLVTELLWPLYSAVAVDDRDATEFVELCVLPSAVRFIFAPKTNFASPTVSVQQGGLSVVLVRLEGRAVESFLVSETEDSGRFVEESCVDAFESISLDGTSYSRRQTQEDPNGARH